MTSTIFQSGLPIDAALPELRAALARADAAVLEAPPGAGKSTVVPLALLHEPWVRGRRLLMLEPRRIAARAVAARMAQTLAEPVGRTVGFRTRFETRIGRETRIEVVTEGVLTRMLQRDPALEGIAAVLFDEFHERSLQADLGLALCLDARSTLGLDLRLLAMSATLDGAAVAALLGGAQGPAPRVSSMGRSFPVDVRYLGRGLPLLPGGPEPAERAVVQAVRRALTESPGDLLVFLPGAAEIRRVAAMLGDDIDRRRDGPRVQPLYGELDAAAQDAALQPDPEGRRRVILATNLAETSLTIPGIRVVVDSGLVRRSLFDPGTGMSRLETQRISRASAEQRAGRAGRVAAGVCYRLWSEGSQRSLAATTPAEILESDLAPLALELAQWGAAGSDALRWLDPPPAAMLAAANDLLRRLGAVDERARLLPHGRELAAVPAHPRLAQLLQVAAAHDALALGVDLAALLSERDLLRGGEADVITRLELLRRGGGDPATLQRVRRIAAQFERLMRGRGIPGSRGAAASRRVASAGLLLAAAYPDRIGRRRAGGERRYTLTSGRGVEFAGADALAREEFIVAVDVDDRDREGRIRLAAAIDRETIEDAWGERIVRREEVEWSVRDEAVLARRVERLDALVLAEKPLNPPPPGLALQAMLQGVRSLGLAALPWDDDSRQFVARLRFVRALSGPGVLPLPAADWPGFADEDLLADLEQWLGPWVDGITRRGQLARLPLLDALRQRLGHERLRQLDALAPTHVPLPTGTRARIDYVDDLAPVAQMRMQEVFGLATTPAIGGGRVPVTFRLLSPAQRPLQVTRDLESFWRNAYAEVRKDMRGRYPRHYWPENPLEAEPTRGTRRPR
jgi:ATP-dependent helicase HrpB